MHLWCDFYVAQPMFAASQLEQLQSVINKHLPEWSARLQVAKDEWSNDKLLVGRDGNLHDAVHRMARPKFGLGDAVLTGSYKKLSMFLNHCESTAVAELNDLTVEAYRLSRIEGVDPSSWARGFFKAVVGSLPIRYGNSRAKDEFNAKNLQQDETGVEAIGVNIRDAIPGLYWLNYLGAPYVDLIGRERLLSAPAFEVQAVGDGVLIALAARADAWQSAEYREREERVIEHVGKQYFFSRHDPNRKSVAPDFAAYRDTESSG